MKEKVKPGIYTKTFLKEVCPCNYPVKIPPLSHQKSKYMRGYKILCCPVNDPCPPYQSDINVQQVIHSVMSWIIVNI